MEKRNLFEELVEGFNGLSDQREGKQILRTHKIATRPVPEISAHDLVGIREKFASFSIGCCKMFTDRPENVREQGAQG